MSYMLQHLTNGWQVDQSIMSEEERVVVIRFGHDWDPTCMAMDEVSTYVRTHTHTDKSNLMNVLYQKL